MVMYRTRPHAENVNPRVVIGHDDRLFVAGLEYLLPPEFEIVDTVHTLALLPDAVRRLRPDVVVQGLSNRPEFGLDVIGRIHELRLDTRIVVVTMWRDAALATDALRRGASAYILSTSAPPELLAGIRAALSNDKYIPAGLAGELLTSVVTSTIDDRPEMTPRQRDVVRLLAQGKLMKEVASVLQMSPRTVAFHKYKVMEEFGIKTTAELVQLAVKCGLV